jgi:hypothetical protein
MIIPADDAAAAGVNLYTKGIGTGSYRFAEVVGGQRIVLEANSHYWRAGLGKVKRLVYRPIIEDAKRPQKTAKSPRIAPKWQRNGSSFHPRFTHHPGTELPPQGD